MTISMPVTPNFTRSRFGLETNTRLYHNPITNTTKRALLSGARWTASYTLPKMTRDQAALWQSFFLQLEGGVNTFYGFDPDARIPRGVATGTPLVKGGSQTGSSLTIDGCTANITGWLKQGDYLSVNGELKMMTADANTNGSGEATLTFKSALRNSPADNAPLTVISPTVAMILVDDMQAMWETDKNGFYEPITFSAIEAIV